MLHHDGMFPRLSCTKPCISEVRDHSGNPGDDAISVRPIQESVQLTRSAVCRCLWRSLIRSDSRAVLFSFTAAFIQRWSTLSGRAQWTSNTMRCKKYGPQLKNRSEGIWKLRLELSNLNILCLD